jgi:hypothetical protein
MQAANIAHCRNRFFMEVQLLGFLIRILAPTGSGCKHFFEILITLAPKG